MAVLDGDGRLTLAEADTLAVRWQVPFVDGEGPVRGQLAFGPKGLAVAAGPRDGAVRVAILDPSDGRVSPLGRAPEGSQVLDLRWREDGSLLTRTREPAADTPVDSLHERVWGDRPAAREIGAWFPHRRYQAASADRVFVDVTVRGLDRGGRLEVDVRYRVWDDPWNPASARPLNDCPEWSDVVHVSADGRLAYTQGTIRCIYDLDEGDVVAWETRQVPFWSTLSPDGALVVERHGQGGRRYGVVRDTRNGKVRMELEDLVGARFTRGGSLLVWTDHRLVLRRLADGATAWSLPLDGELRAVEVSPNAGAIAILEQIDPQARPRARVLDPEGEVLAVVADVEGIRGFSPDGGLLLLEARTDHLGIVDLDAPASSGLPTHRAALTRLWIGDDGTVVSGDEEGRVRRAHGEAITAWQVPGEVHGLAAVDETLTTLSADVPDDPEAPEIWYVSRWRPDDSPRRPTEVARDPRWAVLDPKGEQLLVFTPDAVVVGPPGKRGRPAPAWGGRGGGPVPRTVRFLPEGDRIVGIPDVASPRRAVAWSLDRPRAVGSYPLGLGTPDQVAVGRRRVLVLDGRGAGKVYQLDGGGAVDLAAVDTGGGVCCGAVGGGIVVLGTDRGVLLVMDATTGDRVQSLDPGFVGRITAVAVSPSGDRIVAGSEGGELIRFSR